MAPAMLFPSLTERQYNEIVQRLEEAGTIPGRQYHVCFGSGDRLRVLDVWDPQESFDAFTRTFMPIVEALGIDAGRPEIEEVHNIIHG